MERYALLWLFSTAVLLGLAVWRGLLEQVSPRRSASSTRRPRCSRSRSASSSCCCCTSRSSSRGSPTRTRCSPSGSACCSSASTSCSRRGEAEPPSTRRADVDAPTSGSLPCALTALAVVVVATTAPTHLPGTLAALQPQLGDGDEVVIVDNASRDDTAAVARAAAPRRRVLEPARTSASPAAATRARRRRRAPLLAPAQPRRGARAGLPGRPARGGATRTRAGARGRRSSRCPGGEHVNTAGNVVHWLGFGWAGGCDAAGRRRVERADHDGRLRLGRRARRAPRGVGRGRRLRRALLHVRRGPRPVAAPAPGGLGHRHRAGRARRRTTTSSPRATTSGSASSATAGGRCSAPTRRRCSLLRCAGAAGVRGRAAARGVARRLAAGEAARAGRGAARAARDPVRAARGVQATRTVAPRAFAAGLRDSLDSPYLGGGAGDPGGRGAAGGVLAPGAPGGSGLARRRPGPHHVTQGASPRSHSDRRNRTSRSVSIACQKPSWR